MINMEAVTQLYITMAGFTFFALMVGLYVIAGKDIIFAFKRRFRYKGADIFIGNYNRQWDRYYKTPNKEGNFDIEGHTYITNPEKVGSLGDQMKEKVQKSENKRKEKLNKNLDKLRKKKNMAEQKLEVLKTANNPNIAAISKIKEFIADIEDKMAFLKSNIETKEQVFWMARRPVYFYIRNDPVPKNMFDFLSEFDVIQLDNTIARAQSKDRQAMQDMEGKLKRLQLYLLIAMGITLIAAWFALKGSMGIDDIAKNMGITLSI